MAAEALNEWYYQRNGQKHGPISIDALTGLLDRGEVEWTDLVWTKGFPEWIPASRAPHICFLQDIDGVLSVRPPNRAASADDDLIRMRCQCGVRLKIREREKGQRLRCPKCGSAIRIGGGGVATAPHSRPTPESQPPRYSSRVTGLMRWGSLALFVVACLSLAGWVIDYDRKVRQRRLDEEAAATTQKAEDWLDVRERADRRDGEKIKQELERFLATGVTDADRAKKVVADLQSRIAEIDATFEADKLLVEGKTLLDNGKVEEALEVLNSYVAHPAASRREEAVAIVGQITAATSEQFIHESLSREDDATVQMAKDGKATPIGGVSNALLLSRQRQTAARVAIQILNERAAKRAEEAAAREREVRITQTQLRMKASWEQRQKRLAGRTGPAVPRDNKQQLAAAALGFTTWMLTQKAYEPKAVQRAIDSFNEHLHPVADSGDPISRARALEKMSPEDICIIDDAIAETDWGRLLTSLTQTQGALWLQAWGNAFDHGVMINENPRPQEPEKPKEPVVFLNDMRCPRTREELVRINKQTLAKVSQELRAAGAQGAERFLAMGQAADFLSRFSGIYQSGRNDLIVANVQQVSPQLEAGIQLLFNQTEFGNVLVLVAESDEEVRFLTYSEMWNRAHALQFR